MEQDNVYSFKDFLEGRLVLTDKMRKFYELMDMVNQLPDNNEGEED